jgi:hypothetical protein
MTTITTTELRRPVPRRMRRAVIAALAAAALLAPTALVVSRINDNDSHRIAAPITNLPLDPRSIEFLQPDATPVPVAPSIGLVSAQAAAAEVCSGGLAWACVFTPRIEAAPSGTASVDEAAAEVCRGGLAWACVFTPQLVGQN